MNTIAKTSDKHHGKGRKFRFQIDWSESNFVWLIITTVIVLFLTVFSATSKSDSLQISSSIAVIIVAFPGSSCLGAIESGLLNAKYPQRLSFFIGNAGQKTATAHKSCLANIDSEIIHSFDASISEIFSVDHGANSVKSELINTQIVAAGKTFDFVLEIHAHSLFASHWDEEVISEWSLAGDSDAILTTYPSRTSEISARLFDHHNGFTMNIICHAEFVDNNQKDMTLRYTNPLEIKPPKYDKNKHTLPVEIPFWSALFSFGPFTYLSKVPYDPHLRHILDDEGIEFLYAARLKTSGYNLYAPVRDIVFHNYESHKMLQNHKKKRNEAQLQRDRTRLNQLLSTEKMYKSEDMYGIGTEMSIMEYYKAAGVDVQTRQTANLCNQIKSNQWKSSQS